MTPRHAADGIVVHQADCIDFMRQLPDGCVDSIVTDPPYGLGFMGKGWDDLPPGLDWAKECLRVLKPGGHLLAFGGTRTWHRLAVAVEDAGFEIRDSIAWMYGSGFPKSLDVSKAIDKQDAVDLRRDRARRFQSWLREHLTPQQVNAATDTDMGHHYTTHPTQPSVATLAHLDALRPLLPKVPEWVEEMCQQRTVESETFKGRAVVGSAEMVDTSRSRLGFAGELYGGDGSTRVVDITAPATEAAARWQGWGTALKPAFEPVVVGRKPLIGTVAANVLAHGTGGLNIDACRIEGEPWKAHDATGLGSVKFFTEGEAPVVHKEPHTAGRWPANVVLDESQAAALDEQSGVLKAPRSNGSKTAEGMNGTDTFKIHERAQQPGRADDGGASRFFYVAREDDSCPTSPGQRSANTAGPTTSPPSPPAASAPGGAAILAHPATASQTASPSTSDTESTSSPSGRLTTPNKATTGTGRSPASQPARPSPMVSRARYAASLEPTDTTTTTTDPSTFAGSAGPATSSTTPPSAPGVPLDDLDSRFSYVAKAPTKERPKIDGVAHPTVKPLTLMRWLVRLVTPPGGVVLEPFAGSGTTVEACILEGFRCIAIEREAEYLPLILDRIGRATEGAA